MIKNEMKLYFQERYRFCMKASKQQFGKKYSILESTSILNQPHKRYLNIFMYVTLIIICTLYMLTCFEE